MTRGAHQAEATTTPACPHCGRPMQPNPAGVYGCDHTDHPMAAYDLTVPTPHVPANHTPRPHSGPFALVDRGPLVLKPRVGESVKKGRK